MVNKIHLSYDLSQSEKELIKKNFTSHKDWSKATFDEFKKSLMSHLRNEQKNKCCYCKRELGFDLKEVEIEHIIPKSEYDKFTFHMKNLALSCPGCNTSKNAEQVLYKPIVQYPRSGSNFKIVHAYFDDYDKHITIHFDNIYEGRDEKGINTLGACKIFRLREVLKRQRENDLKNGSLIQQLVQALMQATPEQRQDVDKVIGTILINATK